LEQCDYSPVRNDTAKDGLWKINGRQQAVYATQFALDTVSINLRQEFATFIAARHKYAVL
jgi:hypothetical protein